MPRRVITKDGEPGTIHKLYDDFSACEKTCISTFGREYLLTAIGPHTTDNLKEMWAAIELDNHNFVWLPISMLKDE